jgi:hypothetical protein
MHALGRSLRAETVAARKRQTMRYEYMVEKAKARMRANGERPPRGSLYDAALEEVAEYVGIRPETLRKRIQRLKARK